ncbi:MAG: hypothetical protein ACI4Q3_02505 [Kiritimatiellia bacterium]
MNRVELVCAVALTLAGSVARGEVSYDATSVPGVLKVSVGEEGGTLDAEMVSDGVTNIVKVGPGRLTATPLSSYTGDFTIDEGEFVVANPYDVGANGAGTVFINDGATLLDACVTNDWSAVLASGKTYVFSGKPAEGQPAKFARLVDGGRNYTAANSTFRFLSDAAIDSNTQRVKLKGTIDLGGHVLSCLNDGLYKQTQLDCMVTNGGTICFLGQQQKWAPTYTTLHCESGPLGFYPSENPCVLTVTNANLDIRYSCKANGATLNLIDADLGSARHALKTRMDSYRWDGPVMAVRSCRLAWRASGTNVFNIAGNIGGSGTLAIGPGWLNLSDAPDSAYSGDVTVMADTTGTIATEHSGVALLDNSPFFPAAQSITFQDGANLRLCGSYAQPLPKMTFAGSGTASVAGGNLPLGETPRTTMEGIVKTGDGALMLETPVRVTGTTSLAGGTLQLAPKVYGHAGLWEWTCADMSKGDASGQSCWCQGDADFAPGRMSTNMADAVYSRAGAVKIFTGYDNIVSNGIRRATGVIYQGYLWNRSEEPVTWQLAMHLQYRGAIRLNGSWSLFRESGTNVITTTLQPGPNPILIYSLSANWYSGQTPSACFDGLGLSYDPNPVAGETNVAHFVKLDDGGSGRLFTVDTEDYSAEVAGDLLPLFDNLACAPDTVFDLNGNAFSQGNLAGCPAVANGDLTVTNVWTISAADIAAGRKLAVDGTLAFAPTAKIACADASAPQGRAGDEYEIAVARAVTGEPAIDTAAVGLKNWRVQTTATAVKLVYVPQGMLLLFR